MFTTSKLFLTNRREESKDRKNLVALGRQEENGNAASQSCGAAYLGVYIDRCCLVDA
jgi:hypothetical protein